jgi:hypothetical protein
MRLILYFLLFYVIYRLFRRLIFGPKPKRRVYVNWGRTQQGGFNPFEQAQPRDTRNPDEPSVGSFRTSSSKQSESPRLSNIEDADYEEIKT